jgi:tetratricopeptide (TPR) repeat protein
MKPTLRNVDELYARAYSHHSKGDLALATKKYQEILDKFPNHMGCLHNMARLHLAVNNTTQAIEFLDRVLRINPQDSEALLYRADCERLTHRSGVALEDCHASIAVRDTALAHNTLALVYRDLEKFELAYEEWDKCLALDPDNRAKWAVNMGQTLMLTRDYANGFKLYEGRRLAGIGQARPQAANKPSWTGQDSCANRRIILHWEQGIGDTIQMLRYAEVFKLMGAAWVGVVVQEELYYLAQGIPGVDLVLKDNEDWPLWDLHLSLMSAPRAARTLFQTIPWTGAYIRRRAEPLEDLVKGSLRVGLVWSGGQRLFHEDLWSRPPKSRDIRQEAMLTWVNELTHAYPTVKFVSLQAGRPVPKESGLDLPELKDWATTADIIDTLDLVISVDTAVAHLAGAMNKPVWLMNRKASDWRWHLELDTTPWYPSVRIFRQEEFNDWSSVMTNINKALGELVNGQG